MIEGLNDSKKHFFVWGIVTIVIFLALFIAGLVLANSYGGWKEELVEIAGRKFSGTLLVILFMYQFSTFPMGFYVRRKVMRRYIHVPTEEIKINESNTILAFFRLVKCEILAVINLGLLCFYLSASILFGIVLFPYHIISGIVFLIQKKI